MKRKGKNTYKCEFCTASYIIEAQDDCSQLHHCPNCGMANTDLTTFNIFDTATIDIEQDFWEQIKRASQESKWIPKEYFMNDWVSDVCNFLKESK